MIEECSNHSIRIQKLDALLDGRLPADHPALPEITNEYKRRLAGQRGEKSLYFYLSMLSETKYVIFHGIRLSYKGFFFQIDFLVLCAAFAMVLEAKNRSGEITFEKEFHQVTCKKNGEEERIQNPVLQAKLQAQKLKAWFAEHKCANIPVHYLFVNTNEKTLILSDPNNEDVTPHICNSEVLLDKIEKIATLNKVDRMDGKELRKLKKLLLNKHAPENPDVLKPYNLSPKEIQTGVTCPTCKFLPMAYQYGGWHCQKCNAKSKTAHIAAINDYFLLIKPTITTAELRVFLHIDSIRASGKLLASMNLPFTGNFKNRVYYQLDE